MDNTIAIRIRKALDDKKMSQRQLADAAGLSEISISNYVQGRRIPSGTALKKIADALKVSTDYLLNIESQVNPEAEYKNAKLVIEKFRDKWSPQQKANLVNLLFNR